jgi:cytochrome c5
MAEKHNFSKSTLLTTIAVAIVLTIVIWPLSQMGKGHAPTGNADEGDLRILPVARIEMQKAAGKSDGKPRDGATIYNSICQACHATGVAGAPKAGDKAAWAPRLAQGKATLYKNALNGKNAMPPKGGAADLTEAELKAAVDHLTGLAK